MIGLIKVVCGDIYYGGPYHRLLPMNDGGIEVQRWQGIPFFRRWEYLEKFKSEREAVLYIEEAYGCSHNHAYYPRIEILRNGVWVQHFRWTNKNGKRFVSAGDD